MPQRNHSIAPEKSRILLDVTDTVSYWRGSPTGIQRVLLNLSKASANGSAPCQLVAFDSWRDSFVRIRPETFNNIFKDDSERPYIQSKVWYKKVTTPLFRLLPRSLRRFYQKNFGDYFFERLGRRPPRSVWFEKMSPANNDLLLIIDSNWNQPGYANAIKRLKSQCPFRVAGFVHDIIPITYPWFVSPETTAKFTQWISELNDVADELITNSRYSSSELDNWLMKTGHFKKHSRSVTFGNELFPVAVESSARAEIPALARESETGVILYVGSLDARKNLDCLLRAYIAASEQCDRLPPLVLVGRKAMGVDLQIEMLKHHEILRRKAVWLPDASDSVVEALFTNTQLFVFPSLAEGYGLPVDEALARHIPCIVSNATSLPEVGGNSCEYFNPGSSLELAECILKFFTDREFNKTLKQKAKHHPTRTWSRTLSEFLG